MRGFLFLRPVSQDLSSSYGLVPSQAQRLEDLEESIQELAATEKENSTLPFPPRAPAVSVSLCASRDKNDGSVHVRFSLLKDTEGSLQPTGNSPPPEEANNTVRL